MPITSSIRVAGAVLALTVLSLPQVAAAKPKPFHPAALTTLGADVMPGEVIVAFRPGADNARRAEIRRQENAKLKRELSLEDVELVSVAAGRERAAAASFARRADVAYAEPNAILRANARPDDARFSELWGLSNSGQTVENLTGVADADIDAPEAWNIGARLSSSVRVAVVDSGVGATHEDLTLNMFVNPGESGTDGSGADKRTNGVDDDANGKVDDYRGWDFVNNDNNPADDNEHGSHVAGTIAGRANNGRGVAGVAGFPTSVGSWGGPKIIGVKVLDADGSGSVAQVADGLVYAGTIGAKVANISLGAPGTSPTLDGAISSQPNTLYVIAAGNGGHDGVGDDNDTTPSVPCNSATTPDAPNKICVAATDATDTLGDFSNFGAQNVDLAAPGVHILSTIPFKTYFRETFETDPSTRWTTNDPGQVGAKRWGRSTAFSTSPVHSFTDSPSLAGGPLVPYENNQDNWARKTTPINLTSGQDCGVWFDAKVASEDWYDWFTVEATRTPSNAESWQEIVAVSGFTEGFVNEPLPAEFNGQSGVHIRLRMIADWDLNYDGAYVDDVQVACTSALSNAYFGFNGTSMAAPHVAGAAAFLFTRFPAATVGQIKDKILRSVDQKASLAGKVLTGGRLNLYKAAAESTVAVAGGVLRYTAGTGQTNNVTATRFMDTNGISWYRITDPYSTSTTAAQSGSRLVPGAGCEAINDNTVKCPVAGITRIALTGGDLTDTLNAATIAIPVTLDGGSGLDSLTGGTAGDILTGGTEPDRFAAGAGNDTINGRNEDLDTLFSCGESTGDTDIVNADFEPNDAVVASATNCEVVEKL